MTCYANNCGRRWEGTPRPVPGVSIASPSKRRKRGGKRLRWREKGQGSQTASGRGHRRLGSQSVCERSGVLRWHGGHLVTFRVGPAFSSSQKAVGGWHLCGNLCRAGVCLWVGSRDYHALVGPTRVPSYSLAVGGGTYFRLVRQLSSFEQRHRRLGYSA